MFKAAVEYKAAVRKPRTLKTCRSIIKVLLLRNFKTNMRMVFELEQKHLSMQKAKTREKSNYTFTQLK